MIYTSTTKQLQSLQQLLTVITADQYSRKNSFLSNCSIGQHVRHVIELTDCLLKGYTAGIVNYDDRKRDQLLETDPDFAFEILKQQVVMIQQPDKTMSLQQTATTELIQTTYYRELHYNMEHAIHHMALIKVALQEMKLNVVDGNFGVAAATIQYKSQEQCAQ